MEDDDERDENQDCISYDVYKDEELGEDELVLDRMDRVAEAGKE